MNDQDEMTKIDSSKIGMHRQAALPPKNSNCLCGSGEKFKRCCADKLPGWQLGKRTRDALAAKDYASALVACRADITQYTIWHKTNTDPLLHSAPEAVEYFLNLDIRALTELAELLGMCYAETDKSDEFPATLEQLRLNINHPRWQRKIIYLQAFHALTADKNKRASRRELEKLGSMEFETDIEILQLYIELFHDDLTFTAKQKLVDRIILLAESAIDRLHYRCIRAIDFLLIGDMQDALQEISVAVDAYKQDSSKKADSLYERHRYTMAIGLVGRLSKEPKWTDQAIAICKDLIEEDGWTESGRADLLRQLGDEFRFKGDWVSARDSYRQAYAIQSLPILQVFLAECLVETDGWEIAANTIRTVDLIEPKSAEFVDYVFTFAYIAIAGDDKSMLSESENLLRGLSIPSPYFREQRDSLLMEVINTVRTGKSPAGTNRAHSLLHGMASTVLRYMKLEPNFMGIGINLGKILENLSKDEQAHPAKQNRR